MKRLLLPCLLLFLPIQVFAATSYQVNSTALVSINEFGVCRDVTNNHASGKALMVPTNTSTEWASFYNNPPAGVTVATCCVPTYWNPSDKGSNVTLSNSNKDAASTAGSFESVRGAQGRSSGKYYFEIYVINPASSRAGFADSSHILTTYMGNSTSGAGMAGTANTVTGFTKVWTGTPGTMASGDVLMYALDFAANKAWIGRNGSWLGGGSPTAGTGHWVTGISGKTIYPGASVYPSQGSYRLRTATSEFSYSMPSGYTSWSTCN